MLLYIHWLFLLNKLSYLFVQFLFLQFICYWLSYISDVILYWYLINVQEFYFMTCNIQYNIDHCSFGTRMKLCLCCSMPHIHLIIVRCAWPNHLDVVNEFWQQHILLTAYNDALFSHLVNIVFYSRTFVYLLQWMHDISFHVASCNIFVNSELVGLERSVNMSLVKNDL